MKQVRHLKPVSVAPKTESHAALPRPIIKSRDKALQLLSEYLVSMMDGAEDTLFDFAEAGHGHEQDRYFRAMRELRVKRSGVESRFQQALQNAFLQLTVENAREAETPVDFESLALVHDDEIEIDVAISNMARRIRQGCEEQLRIFNHRLEYLFEGRRALGEERNPLEPQIIARCFEESLQRLDLDIGTKLIIFKLFERMVLVELGYIITEANQELIDAGILPDLVAPPIAAVRRPNEAYRSQAAMSDTAPVNTPAETAQMFGMLQELLAALHSVTHAHAAGVGALAGSSDVAVMHGDTPMLQGAPIAPDTPIKAISSHDLVEALSRLQRFDSTLESENQDLRASLASLLKEENQEALPTLEQADDDVINLVAMLFDFILDDPNLSGDIKALLGRLQIPLLKIAVVDKSFFSNEQHAARGLLNTLARAGAQWSPQQGKEDELYQKIHLTISQVLQEHDTNTELFSELLKEFEHYIGQHNARSERIEARVREMEEGRFKTDNAKKIVQDTLQSRLAGRSLPSVALELLQQGWQQVMYLTYLREGDESLAWEQALRVVDAVVWSVNLQQNPIQLKRLRSIGPRLIRNLQKGLEDISYDAVTVKEWLKGLHQVYMDTLKGETLERTEVVVEQPQEVTALTSDDPRVRQVAKLRVGQWVAFEQSDGETLRCKLAANLREGEKLIFINARGIKIAEHNAVSLAMAIHENQASLINEDALFDRALEAVINDLRQRQAVHA